MHKTMAVPPERMADYFSEWLVASIAATIAGSKPSTILTMADTRYHALLTMWRHVGKAVLNETIIRFIVLHSSEQRETVLFFREDTLARCIAAAEHREFLVEQGYPVDAGLEGCLDCLKQRFAGCCPHEIGVLLGIPLKDVLGFMGLSACDVTCRGEWCIYGQPDDTLALMRRYAEDRDFICELIENGISPCRILRGMELPQAV